VEEKGMATEIRPDPPQEEIGDVQKYDFRTESEAVFKAQKGLSAEVVNQISDIKEEPEWMRKFRLRSLDIFHSKPMPDWGGDISLDFDDIYYYLKPTTEQGRTWDDVPEEIKDTFEKLGIPEA
jgi:Fe-S cluster assembly protein SufB